MLKPFSGKSKCLFHYYSKQAVFKSLNCCLKRSLSFNLKGQLNSCWFGKKNMILRLYLLTFPWNFSLVVQDLDMRTPCTNHVKRWWIHFWYIVGKHWQWGTCIIESYSLVGFCSLFKLLLEQFLAVSFQSRHVHITAVHLCCWGRSNLLVPFVVNIASLMDFQLLGLFKNWKKKCSLWVSYLAFECTLPWSCVFFF